MNTNSTPATFDFISRANHWIVAFAMIGMLGFGLFLENADLARSVRGPLIGLHKALGVLVLIYGIWRVGYRIRQGFPAALGDVTTWQEFAAKGVHWILLAGIIIMPVSGIVMSVFEGRPVNVFDIFVIPAVGNILAVAEVAETIHAVAGKVLIFVIALHFLAVLKHRIIDRDATLTRMVTGKTE